MSAFIERLAPAVLTATVDALWQGVLLASLAAITLGCLPRLNAATRYGVWWVTLLAIVLLPWINGRRIALSTDGEESSAFAIDGGEGAAAAAGSGLAESYSAPMGPRPAAPERSSLFPAAWASYVLAAWALVTVFCLMRLAVSMWHVVSLKRRSAPLDPAISSRFEEPPGGGRRGRSARILASSRVASPVALGFLRPAVLLPARLAEELGEDELDKVVLHELAHIRRWDDWANLLEKLIESAFFFHPAVRWVARRLSLEREHACDDWVISETRKPKDYAVCLTRLAALSCAGPRGPLLASGALSGWLMRGETFSRRIDMLLDPERNASPRFSRPRLLLASAMLAVAMLPFLWFSPAVGAHFKQAAEEELRARRAQEQAERARLEAMEALEREQQRAEGEFEAAMARLREQEMRVALAEEGRAKLEGVRQAEESVRRRLAELHPAPYPLLLPVEGGREPVIGEDELNQLLVDVAREDSDPRVRDAAMAGLGSARGEEAATALISLYDGTDDGDIKIAVIGYLGRNASRPAVDKLKSIARSDPEPDRRLLAVSALSALGRPGLTGLPVLAPAPPEPRRVPGPPRPEAPRPPR